MLTYNLNSIKALLSAVLVVLALNGCTDGWEDMNKPNFQPKEGEVEQPEDPEDPEEPEEPKPIVGDPGDYIYEFTYNGVIDNHQRTTNLYHDLYAHYFANNKFEASNHYLYRDDWMKFRWEHFYTDRFQEFKNIIKICKQDTDKHFRNAYHIAWINYYFLVSLMTDTYGPIPCTSVIDNMEYEIANDVIVDDPNIYYDTQEQVYDRLFKRLAVHQDSLLVAGEETYTYGERDNIFGGDALQWKRFANSLRLRLAMRISNIDPIRAQQEAQAAIAAGVMESNDDTYAVHYNWPNGHENDYALVGFLWGDVVMSKDLEVMYKTQSTNLDPRCSKCWYKNMTPHASVLSFEESQRGDYVGNYNGAENVQHGDHKYSYLKSRMGERNNDYWFDYNRPMECLNYAEVCFLLAEANLRGWAGASSSAETYYKDGIRASMDYFTISTTEADAYINGLKTDPFSSGDKEAMLEQIINQKWLANFPNGAEGWADFRRTDYPALTQIVSNRSSDVEQGKFIKRINYPVSEHDLNSDNIYYPYADDSKGLKLWWDVMDTQSGSNTRNTPNNFR